MNVFVAGGSGFVGSHVCRALADSGHLVRSGYWKHRPRATYDERCCDLREEFHCRAACDGMDAVVMCAAVTSGAKDIVERPQVHAIDNTVMNTRMLSAAFDAGVKHFVFVSSSTVYPDSDLAQVEYNAGKACAPYEWVGNMKLYAEQLGGLFDRAGMKFTALRPANMYGPGDSFDFAKCHMVPALVRRVAERQNPILIWGDGKDVRNLLYVEDFARAVVMVLEKPPRRQAYNVTPEYIWSVEEVLHKLISLVPGYSPEVVFGLDKPRTIKRRVLSGMSFHRECGWSPKVDFEEGLRRTLEWYGWAARKG